MPAPTRLAFDVNGQAKKFAYSARAELLWQHDGNRYEARQEISAFLVGTRTQRSVGTVTEQGLLPEKFSDKSRSEDKDGYGLGLYVVKTILSQHKEQITVTSENGVTAFSFTVQMAHPMRNEP